MKRAALVAGVSFAALLLAGSAKVQAAQNPETWWTSSRAIATSSPPAWRSLKARSRASEKAEGKAGRAANKSPPIPSGPLHIIVSIDKQRATLFADGRPVASTAISSGTAAHPTPMGVFTVIQKDRHHVSNLYDASMPYMQRITWSGSALHQGPLPGYPASHGCVRLTESFAQLLWKTTKMGARIIVTRPDVAPLEFAHARLFVPKPKMVAAPPAVVPAPAPVVAAEPATTSSMTKVRTANATNTTAVAIDSVAGDATKAVTTAVVTEPVASTAAEQPTKQSDTDGVGGTREPAEAKAAEAQPVEAMPDESRSVEAKSDDAKPVEAKPVKATVVATKPVETKPAEVKQFEAKPVEARSIPIAAPTPIIIDERPKTMPATIVQEANGRPISVFVSLKENKLYVRQGWKPLFDAPVSFEHPEQPIGTHVYTAMGAKAEGGLRWTVVSIPSSYRRVAEAKNAAKNSDSGRKGRRQEHAVKAVEVVAPMPSPSLSASLSPSAALDRIVMPPELVERVAEMITPGSSLIVSDNRLSDETGEYTDFIVLTR
jgi:lipoprotein-anchoring transpeptidase ErfK/SrfK